MRSAREGETPAAKGGAVTPLAILNHSQAIKMTHAAIMTIYSAGDFFKCLRSAFIVCSHSVFVKSMPQ